MGVLTPERAAEMCHVYRDTDRKAVDIARDFGVSVPTLHYHLKRLQIPTNRANSSRRSGRKLPGHPPSCGEPIAASAFDIAGRKATSDGSAKLLRAMAGLLSRTPAWIVSGVDRPEPRFNPLPPPSLTESGNAE